MPAGGFVKQLTSSPFFRGGVARNDLPAAGLRAGAVRVREPTMRQRLQPRRSAYGERLWLSVLIDTMERVSQPERRTAVCDPSLLAKVRAQLQRPASTYRSGVSYFSPPELDRRL